MAMELLGKGHPSPCDPSVILVCTRTAIFGCFPGFSAMTNTPENKKSSRPSWDESFFTLTRYHPDSRRVGGHSFEDSQPHAILNIGAVNSASHLGNGRRTRIPYLHWLSVHGSGRILGLLVLPRLAPFPGSLPVLRTSIRVLAGLLVSIIAFGFQLLGRIMP